MRWERMGLDRVMSAGVRRLLAAAVHPVVETVNCMSTDSGRGATIEPLEGRTMLSITWVNRNTPGEGEASFVAVYGGDAARAIAIVDRAIEDWEAVVTDFGYADLSNDFELDVNAASLAIVVSNTTGRCLKRSDARIVSVSVKPSTRGISTSESTRSAPDSRRTCQASTPSTASSTS